MPFWSQDSRFIAFFSTGFKLRKVPVEGGPSQTICDTTTFAGGTWNRDGTILFSQLNGGLMLVPQAGGKAALLTTVDGSGGESDYTEPQFLPDGRHFLYLARAPQDDTGAIFLGSLGSKEKKLVVRGVGTNFGAGGTGIGWAPPGNGFKRGHVLFLRENVLMAQPIDASSLDPAGEAFPLAQQAVSVSVSSNGVLAYGNADVIGSRLQQMRWVDRSGKLLSDVGLSGIIRDLVLSPDAKRVAFSLNDGRAGSARSVWVMDTARGIRSRLSFEPGEQRFIVWSPDGTEVAYGTGAGRAHDRIMVRRADGSGDSRQLRAGGIDLVPRDWSSDGKWLLYREVGPQTRSDLWTLPMGPGNHEKPIPLLQSKYEEIEGRFRRMGAGLRTLRTSRARRKSSCSRSPKARANSRFPVVVEPYNCGGAVMGGNSFTWRPTAA